MFFNVYENSEPVIKPFLIIGEDEDNFYIDPYISDIGYWDTDNIVFSILELSYNQVHKSRLIPVKDVPIYLSSIQLSIF